MAIKNLKKSSPMNKFSKGYITRYSGGSSAPLSRKAFACLSLAKFISKQFGPGNCYYYTNDQFSTNVTIENSQILDYFFKDIYIVKRSKRLELYRKEAIKVIETGWAVPSKNADDFIPNPLSVLSIEEMVKSYEENKDLCIKLKKSTQSQVVLDDLIRGPYHANISPGESQLSLMGTNGQPLPVMSNVSDDNFYNVNIVVREWDEKHRSIQEIYLHYMMGTCPPYYIHVDFDNDFKIETTEYIKNKLPPENLIDSVIELMTDKSRDIIYTDFRFIKPKVEKFTEIDMKRSLLLNIKNCDKESRDAIIKAACPNACDQHVSIASDISRMMVACDCPYDAILDVCKAVCSSTILYKGIYAPNESSPEFANLEALIMRISSHDFINSKISLEEMILAFCQKAAINVEKIDYAMEFCVIGSVHKNKTKKWWWYEIARSLGREVICSRIKNAIKFIKTA